MTLASEISLFVLGLGQELLSVPVGQLGRQRHRWVAVRYAVIAVLIVLTASVAVRQCVSSGPLPGVIVNANGVVRANDFLNSLGVDEKVIQGAYSTATATTELNFTGVRLVREDSTTNLNTPPQSVQDLCNLHSGTTQHVLFDELPVVGDISNTQAEWDYLAGCGAMLQAEGPNEPNNFPFTYLGTQCNQSTTFLPCAQFQRDLYAMVKADNALKNFNVAGTTHVGAEPYNTGIQYLTIPTGAGSLLPDGTPMADLANVHNYVQGNGAAGTTLIDNHARYAEIVGTIGPYPNYWGILGEYWYYTYAKGFPAVVAYSQNVIPKVTTETGWDLSKANIGQAMQGKLLTDVYLDAYQLGWSNTFIYQLQNTGDGTLFGLYSDPSTPTSLGTYVHNLTTILADTSSAFTPTNVNFTLTNLPKSSQDANLPYSAYYQLFQKSTGKHELVVWGEGFASQTPATVTVGFPTTQATVNVYDITSGTSPINTYTNVAFVSITIEDHAVVVEF